MSQLHVYQSMWAMEQLPWGEADWSLEQQVAKVADAGFDGVSVEFADLERARTTCALAIERGLHIEALGFPSSVEELAPVLELAVEVGLAHVTHVAIQPDVRPLTVSEGVPYVLGWQELAAQTGVPFLIETHRGRLTTDLLYTVQLLDAIPNMRVVADLSHFVVGREFRWPVSEENHALIHRVLRRAAAFHGRVASREQVQLQISFPQHRQWLQLFEGWWEAGFRLARAADPDAIVTFTCELGPRDWYAMTGPDGEELSDRWAEALMLRDVARRIWAGIEHEESTDRGTTP